MGRVAHPHTGGVKVLVEDEAWPVGRTSTAASPTSVPTPASTPPLSSGPCGVPKLGEQQPPPQRGAWLEPTQATAYRTGLVVNNSLKADCGPNGQQCCTEFLPVKGRSVKWYSCGPTVCDPPTLGHCRTYMTFDIVRRIMEDYFNYNVTLAMGVTDIDDKIIIRSKEIMTLVREGFARPDAMSALMACGDVSAARDELRARGAPQKDVDDTDGGSTASAEERAAAADATLLAREMETRFFSDLSRLHIKPPTVVTRVTEHVPSIIKFVQRILSNGFAYVTEDGNRVYFDVIAFSKKHKYAKLMSRCSEGDEDGLLTRNCEGILLQGKRPQKKHPKDFILWRKSDEGEPMWDSPWGKGRPGWHIECSTMASEVLGQCIDLHTGCEDLKFPHHDNELAQSEAHWENHQWVNYFLHHGSLHADAAYLNQLPTPCASRACKSTAQQQAQQNSKKSFTIEDILQVYTSRHVRMLFVLHPYDDALLFTKSSMAAAAQEEEFFCQFFERVRPFTYGEDQKATLLWDDTPERFESALSAAHDCADDAVHRALCSNFDTPTAMQELKKLAEAVLTYVAARERSGGVRVCLLNKALHYIRKIFGVFGLLQGGSDDFVREAPPSTSPSSAAAFSLNKAVCALNPCLRSLPPSASTSADTAFQNPKVSATIDAFFDLKRTVEEQLRCALGGGGAAAAASSQPSNPSSLPPYADGSAAAAGAAGGPAGPAGTAPAGGGALPVGGAGAASALHSDPTVDPRFHSHNEADDDDDSSFQSSDLRALNSGLLNFKRYFKPAPSDDGKQTHAQQQQQQQQPLGSNGTGDNGDDDDGSSNCGSNGGTAGSNGIALAHRTRTKREKVKRKKYVDTLRVLSDVCAVFEEKTLPQLGIVPPEFHGGSASLGTATQRPWHYTSEPITHSSGAGSAGRRNSRRPGTGVALSAPADIGTDRIPVCSSPSQEKERGQRTQQTQSILNSLPYLPPL